MLSIRACIAIPVKHLSFGNTYYNLSILSSFLPHTPISVFLHALILLTDECLCIMLWLYSIVSSISFKLASFPTAPSLLWSAWSSPSCGEMFIIIIIIIAGTVCRFKVGWTCKTVPWREFSFAPAQQHLCLYSCFAGWSVFFENTVSLCNDDISK